MKQRYFRVQILITRLDIRTDSLSVKARATAILDSKAIQFPQIAQIKHNSASFHSRVQFSSVQLIYRQQPSDNKTRSNEKKPKGAYQERNIKLWLEFIEDNNSKVTKMGQVDIDLGKILNSKKVAIPLAYPIAKSYDKSSTVKVSVDLQMINEALQESLPIQEELNRKIWKKIPIKQQKIKDMRPQQITHERIAQQKQIEYLKKKIKQQQLEMTKMAYRNVQLMRQNEHRKAQNERLLQLIQKVRYEKHNADHQLEMIQNENENRKQQLERLNIDRSDLQLRGTVITQQEDQIKSLKMDLKRTKDELEDVRNSKAKLVQVYQYLLGQKGQLSRLLETSKRNNLQNQQQIQLLKDSVASSAKRQQAKDRHFRQQQEKYTQKFLQSEHDKNATILQMQSKFNQQRVELQRQFSQATKKLQTKMIQANKSSSLALQKLQNQLEQKVSECQLEKKEKQNKIIENRQLQSVIIKREQKINSLTNQLQQTKKTVKQSLKQIDQINVLIQTKDSLIRKIQEDLKQRRIRIQQLQVETQYANQTIKQQGQTLTQQSNQIRFAGQRYHFLQQQHQEELYRYKQKIQLLTHKSNNLEIQCERADTRTRICQDKILELNQGFHQKDRVILKLESELKIARSSEMRVQSEKIVTDSNLESFKRQNKELTQINGMLRKQIQQYQRYLLNKNSLKTHNQYQSPSHRPKNTNSPVSLNANKWDLYKARNVKDYQQQFYDQYYSKKRDQNYEEGQYINDIHKSRREMRNMEEAYRRSRIKVNSHSKQKKYSYTPSKF